MTDLQQTKRKPEGGKGCGEEQCEHDWDQISIILERISSMSSFSPSSSAPPSSWWWSSVACVVCPSVVGSVVVVVAMEAVGRTRCVSLLVTQSPSMESLFEPSCVVVSQVVSFVRS